MASAPARLHHPGLGAVPADADPRAHRRHAGAGLSRRARSARARAAPRSICRRGAPAGWRAISSSTSPGRDAAILPRIVAIGDVDEDEIAFAEAATGALAADALDLPPALGGLERRLLLAQLVLKWAARIAPDAARRGAARRQQSRLGARARRRSRAPDGRHDHARRAVGPARRARARRRSTATGSSRSNSCKIAREAWPQILAERGAIEPAARRDALIKAEAARLAAHTDGPVIAAGSTGSMPATAELIADHRQACRTAPWCCPASTPTSTTQSWDLIGGRRRWRRPRYARGRPSAIRHAGAAAPHRHRPRARSLRSARRPRMAASAIVSEALRPAAATERWQQLAGCDVPLRIDRALETVAVIEAANAEEEALAIAVALREARRDAATRPRRWSRPTARLARRVLAALERWQIAVDDSGGDALADTPAGRVRAAGGRSGARRACAGDAARPAQASAAAARRRRRCACARDRGAGTARSCAARGRGRAPPGSRTRSQRSAPSSKNCGAEKPPICIRPIRARASPTRSSMPRPHLVARLSAALAPLEALAAAPFAKARGAPPQRHRRAERGRDRRAGRFRAAPTAQRSRARSTTSRCSAADADFAVAPRDYADLFRAAISPTAWCGGRRCRACACASTVRSKRGCKASIASCSADWSRACGRRRRAPIPGSAGRCATRSASICRSGASALRARLRAGARRARGRSSPIPPSSPARRPWPRASSSGSPRSPAKSAGTRRSRARRELSRLGARARPSRRGQAHRTARAEAAARRAADRALGHRDRALAARPLYDLRQAHPASCARSIPSTLPPGARRPRHRHPRRDRRFHQDLCGGAARRSGRRAHRDRRASISPPLDDYPEARAFWWPRFQRIARWFAGWETRRRGSVAALDAEIGGKIDIPLGERVFTLRARADRIERLADGRYAILDYKTGPVPTEKQVRIGLSPQLTLEARDPARRRISKTFPPAPPSPNWSTSRSRAATPPATTCRSTSRTATPDAHADRALAKLTSCRDALRGRAAALSVRWCCRCGRARYGDLRPPRAGEGMVASAATR